MIPVHVLWFSEDEQVWLSALNHYWDLVKPNHLRIEKEFNTLDRSIIEKMDASQWYDFLLNKYFLWKYTSPNRYVTTTKQLKKYLDTPYGLEELFIIKKNIFHFDLDDIGLGLGIVCSIRGLGTAGGSGLLAVLFPEKFATVDQFVVTALAKIENLPEKPLVALMRPKELTQKNGVVLIEIMKKKAKALNALFDSSFWTPRKIDMILWSVDR